ncbi:hypothetical protein OEB99_17035 [Actinotalea sp. M2MS4P-6]|uniref:hypothetical protein n=1 Tax=Actinotalea sp. M2MS4P-6 TaxID=2983762 RepID=UPI0021E41593|nr:hypothetical protein [Actinotalea sp. M2MS4P-6]MCV2396021.1 hypothetical protein [Actinotalea sp. M2MS4P-6]
MAILDLDAGELVFGTGKAVVVGVTCPTGHATLEVGHAHSWDLLARSGPVRWTQDPITHIIPA